MLQTCPQTSSFYTHLPAYEDGTVFRNVRIQNSDAEESPKRKHTTTFACVSIVTEPDFV